MAHTFFISLILFISTSLWAANEIAPQLRSSSALSTALQKDQYSADLKEGFHFNDKAPNQLQVDGQAIKPSLLKAQKIRFQMPAAYKNAEALLYVCDDAITYCETHKVSIKNTDGSNQKSLKSPTSNSNKRDAHGFWQGNLEKAFAEAQKKNQLVLLDFTARWCPGCVRNKTEIFPTPAFKKIAHDIVKVKVDVDQFENFAVSEKYHVKGIPTLVLVNAKDEEIDRLVGFEPLPRIESFLKAAKEDPTPAVALLQTDASADAKTQLKAGLRLLASGKTAESVGFLGRVQPTPPEFLYAKVTAAQEAFEKDERSQKEDFARALREAIKTESDSTRSIAWRTELVKLDPKSKEAQSMVKDGSALADALLKDDAKLAEAVATDSIGEFKGYEKWVVALNKADLLEAAEAPEEEQLKALSAAADLGIAYRIPVSKKGPALRQLVLLSSSRRWAEAEAHANAILKTDPSNTDVKRRKVRILNALNKFKDAIALAEKILPQSEGRNEFWVAELLAKSYIGAEKKDDAKKLLTAYLARPEIQTEKMKSSKKGMEDLLKSLL